MTRPSAHQVELLLNKEELLVPADVEALKTRLAGIDAGKVAIAEIAGRDSIGAVLAAVDSLGIEAIVPTAVYTGTEYGDWSVLFNSVDRLQRRLAGTDVAMSDLVLLGSPRLWGVLNGRHMARLADEFGYCTPCVGCHLYLHLVRVPLAWALAASKIISGERESHDGRVKINQTASALDAYVSVIEGAGIDLVMPIRHMTSGEDVQGLLGEGWAEGDRQLGCVLSKNYVDREGAVIFDEDDLSGFLDRFVVPAGRAIVKAWRSGQTPDYEKIVALATFVGEQPACG